MKARIKRIATLAAGFAALAVTAHAATAPAPEPDWSDSLKKIGLNSDGSINLSLGGSARGRFEHWDNFAFGKANDEDLALWRFYLNGSLQLGPNFRLFVEGKIVDGTDRDLPLGRRTIDVDSADLHQAFGDITFGLGDGKTTLRLGRQELLYGKQRLISPLDWVNNRRNFDGAKIVWKSDAWQVDAFATRPVNAQKYEFDDGDIGQDFFGLYATHKVTDALSYDVYALSLDKEGSKFGAVTNGADEKRHTVGTRIFGKAKCGADYDTEAAYQFGEFADADISAYMLALELGYTFDAAIKPRVYLGFDYASGDKDPKDDELGTFNQLYPLGHAYFGYIDIVGRQNILDYQAGFSLKPLSKLALKIDGHLFERADTHDALYNAAAGVVRGGKTGASRDIGSEVDVTAKIEATRHLALLLGYSHFFTGDFIEQSGAHEDTDFAYASAELTF